MPLSVDSSVRLSSVRAVQGVAALVLALLTIALLGDPGVGLAMSDPSLNLVVNTLAASITLGVAALAYGRARETREPTAVFDAGAFLLIGLVHAVHVTVLLSAPDAAAARDPSSPPALPVYLSMVGRAVSIGLLLLGVAPTIGRRVLSTVGMRAVVLAPALFLVALAAGLALTDLRLDPLFEPEALRTLAASPDAGPVPARLPILVLNLVAAAALFVVAYLRPMQPGRTLPSVALAVAFAIGAFGQIHYALFRSAAAGVITTADLLDLAFYVSVFGALQATRSAEGRLVRRADERRRRFHHADVAAAAQGERLALARELHDTVVQSLLTIRREHAIASELVPPDDVPARLGAARVTEMLGQAVDEAQRLIEVLREGTAGERRLTDELGPRLRAFSDQHGYSLEFRDDPALAVVSGSRVAEIMRIVVEALTNVARHADATTVRVAVARVGEQLILTIADNGRGFDAEHTPHGHGVTGMFERADLLGGRLAIHSAPGEGTQIRLFVPLDADGG